MNISMKMGTTDNVMVMSGKIKANPFTSSVRAEFLGTPDDCLGAWDFEMDATDFSDAVLELKGPQVVVSVLDCGLMIGSTDCGDLARIILMASDRQ
jgi:hypothetical protein